MAFLVVGIQANKCQHGSLLGVIVQQLLSLGLWKGWYHGREQFGEALGEKLLLQHDSRLSSSSFLIAAK